MTRRVGVRGGRRSVGRTAMTVAVQARTMRRALRHRVRPGQVTTARRRMSAGVARRRRNRP